MGQPVGNTYRPVWEIGRKDGSAAEFALYDGAYSDLLGRFPARRPRTT